MTYDSPFWAIEEEVISEVVVLKRKVWWPQKDEIKESWKYVCPWMELNPGHPSEMQECWHFTV